MEHATKVDMAVRELRSRVSMDFCGLEASVTVGQALAKMAKEFECTSVAAKVLFSDHIKKKGEKGKERTVILLVTARALYTIHPDSMEILRRVGVERIDSVKVTLDGDECVFLIRDERGLWLRSKRRDDILYFVDMARTSLSGIGLLGAATTSDELAASMIGHTDTSSLRVPSPITSPSSRGSSMMNSTGAMSHLGVDYDFDLSYVRDNLIVMAFPSDGSDVHSKTPYSLLKPFLDKTHGSTYIVINLCSERRYEASKFDGRVKHFPIDEQGVTTMKKVHEFCAFVQEWLDKSNRHSVVVHSKAGKDRSGFMIACYLLYANLCKAPGDAVAVFSKARSMKDKVLTIPSQRRYIVYFHQYLVKRRKQSPSKQVEMSKCLTLKTIRISSIPHFDDSNGCSLYFQVYNLEFKKIFDSRSDGKTTRLRPTKGVEASPIELGCRIPLQGDIKVSFYHEDEYSFNVEMFHLWFDVDFVKNQKLSLCKHEIDKAVRDVNHSKFDKTFEIDLEFDVEDSADAIKPRPFNLTLSKTDKSMLSEQLADSRSSNDPSVLYEKCREIEEEINQERRKINALGNRIEDVQEENEQLVEEQKILRKHLEAATAIREQRKQTHELLN